MTLPQLPLGRITDKYVRESLRKLASYLDSSGSTSTGGSSASATPPGQVVLFAGPDAPSGWLICDGSSLLRNEYAELFAAIGVTWGSADTDHFTLPDMRGQVAGGVSASHALATAVGAETHTLTLAETPAHNHGANTGTGTSHLHAIDPPSTTTADAGSHSHGGYTNNGTTDGTHTHTYNDSQPLNDVSASIVVGPDHVDRQDVSRTTTTTGSAHRHVIASQADHNHIVDIASFNSGGEAAHTHSITSNGSGNAHNNMQPTKFLHYIIKV